VLDKAEYSAFESTLNSAIVSFRISVPLMICFFVVKPVQFALFIKDYVLTYNLQENPTTCV